MRFIVLHPWVILALTFAVTAAFLAALAARGIEFDGSPETLARNDQALRFFDEIRQTFGDDRVIIVALDTADVVEPRFLRDLDRLTRKLASVEGVDEAQSLTNIKAIRGGPGDIRIERLVPANFFCETASPEERQELRREVIKDPLYVRHFVSPDGRTAAINIFLKPMDAAGTRAATERIEIVARSETLPYRLMFAGVPIIESRGVKNMVRDFSLLSPIAALLCFLAFLFVFRTLWGALLPMAALVMGLIWTMGLMSLCGKAITLTTLAIPTVLMAVGSSYLFHVLNQYRISMAALPEAATYQAGAKGWLEGLHFIGPAVLVSGTTTMAGFGALASSTVPTVRDMGAFDAFGVLAMLALAVAFIPAALALLPAHALGCVDSKKDHAAWLNNILRHATALTLFRGRAVLVFFSLLTLMFGSGVIWLRVNTDYLKIFPRNSETVRDAEEIHERLAGVVTVQLIVDGKLLGQPATGRVVFAPQFLDGLTKLEQFALNQPGVDAAISIADIVSRLRAVATDSRSGATQMGADSDRSDLLKIVEEDESAYRLVNRDFSMANLVLRTNLSGSIELRALTDKLTGWARANMPPDMSVRVTGSAAILNDAADSVAYSQVWSLSIAIIAIYLMMVALFRSFATGLLALLPNLLPIISFFGFLGWAGITLDITTSLIASAVLGLAVDNAVHMIRRYRQSVAERATGSAEDEGWIMWLTMLRTGKPMVLANSMLIAAFLIFVLSSFAPVRTGGVLWALTILACLIADALFLPALIKTRLLSRAAIGRDPRTRAGVQTQNR